MLFSREHVGIGLDISDQTLRAVELKRTLRGKLGVRAYSACKLEPGICLDGTIQKPEKFTDAISNLINRPLVGKFSSSYVVVSLPETKTFIKTIDIPPMPQAEAQAAVRWEAEHHIPIPFEETYWDYQIIGDQAQPNNRLPVLLGLVPKDIAESYNDVLTKAELIPVGFEIEAVAISRSLNQWEQTTNQTNIIIDLGATRTSLIVTDSGVVLFTVSLPISGTGITKTIAQELSLSEPEAEQAKIVCGLDSTRGGGAVAKVLKKDITELIRKIQDAIAFYREHFPTRSPIGHVILCGGGANFLMLDNYLSQELALTVIKGNPLTNINSTNVAIPEAELLSYSTALGLSLRSFIPNIPV